MEIVTWILSFAVMVGVLVIVHEAGHYLVARAFGIGAPVFSVGVGPPLLRLFHWRGTDFVLSALPIGGYVRLSGADPFGEEDADTYVDPAQDFMRRPVWQRFLVMFAGPAMNLVLPYVLFTALLTMGEPQMDNTIGTVLPGSPAAELGLRPGDRVVSAAGQAVDVWADLFRVLDDEPGHAVILGVERSGSRFEVVLPEGAVKVTPEGLVDSEALGFMWYRRSSRLGVSDVASPAWKAGLRPGDAIVEVDGAPVETWEELLAALAPGAQHRVVRARPVDGALERTEVVLVPDAAWSSPADESDPNPWGLVHGSVFVGTVMEGSAAEQAGLQVGDRMWSIDGHRVRSWSDVLTLVAGTTDGNDGETATARELTLVVVRGGEPKTLGFTPKVEREFFNGVVRFRPIMGVRQFSESFVDGDQIDKHYSLPAAFGRAVEETNGAFEQTIGVLSGLVVGRVKIAEGLGGPVAIFQAAGTSAEAGIFTFVRMMGMISISLGIVNLLPVPVLDGGQITVYAIEAIRGRPLPLRIREGIQMAGFLMLAALLLVVTVMDFQRLWQG